ncbi:DUF87 domain-containing protein, partial [Candidatus Woesearchaeota archaeon]|nr:DUF87 domain-containing protein [Candidatus Woesearchaeota archaeon]
MQRNRTLDDLKKGRNYHKYNIVYTLYIAVMVVLVFISLVFVAKYIGYYYHAGEAGYIYETNLIIKKPAEMWAGVYGMAVRVPGYTNQQSADIEGNDMVEKNLLFDCLQPDINNEVYASLTPPDNIDWDTIQEATTDDVDDYLGTGGTGLTAAANTYTQTGSVDVGTTQLSPPITYTYDQANGSFSGFDTGILKDWSGHLVYFAHIKNFTHGFDDRIYNYQIILPVKNNTEETYYFFTDPYDVCPAGEGELNNPGNIIGNITSDSGLPLEDVIVDVAGYTTASDANGFYNLSVPGGTYNLYAVKTGYEVYYSDNITIVPFNTTVHNIILTLYRPPQPERPPFTDVGPGQDDGPGEIPEVPILEQPKEIEGTDYIISVTEINRKLQIGNFLQEQVIFYSYKENAVSLGFEIEGNVTDMIELDRESLVLSPNSQEKLTLTIFGKGDPEDYNGTLVITGGINEEIPIHIELLDKEKLPIQALIVDLEAEDKITHPGNKLRFRTDLKNMLTDQQYPVTLFYTVQNSEGNETLWTSTSNVFLHTSFSLLKNFEVPEDMDSGEYIIRVTAHYLGLSSGASTTFKITMPFYLYSVFGVIRVWQLILIILLIGGGVFGFWFYKKKIEERKKYHLRVDYNELPKPGPNSLFVGKIAETNKKTYFNMQKFTTHTIVAGATGGGKSFTAQDLIEELLLKDVAVIVFDPTAQWSGMLRKLDDPSIKRMYPLFDMDPKEDTRAFNGNIRQVENALEIIDIKKYMKPGEIQVFTLNKLDPKDIDIFVANTIKEVFHANFDESRKLRLVLVYDEVHRLLPRFGGSGEGFIQIERACREFRKWGVGVFLISQVLADFVGEIKANINTEVQMRTRSENDLNRIKTKYGEEVLQSLVKASVGTGMVENPAYNLGKPYFVTFRPIMHSVTRLSDEELDKYNQFNKSIDQLQYELEQMKELGEDVFDLNLELKLATNKLKEGSFNMVKIYLDGLEPRVKKIWGKLGKEPKKLKPKLADIDEIKAEVEKAKKARNEYEKEHPEEKPKEEKEDKKKLKYEITVPFDKALEFKNGVAVTSLQELLDVLPTLSGSIYNEHINDEHNDVADWIEKTYNDSELASKLRSASSKKDMIDALNEDKAKNNKPMELAPGSGTAEKKPEDTKSSETEKKEEPKGAEATEKEKEEESKEPEKKE